MLVPFVIDADSLAPDPAWTPAQLRACHTGLLDIWQQIGLLIHDAESFQQSRLNTAVQELPQALRSLWQELLPRVPLAPCGMGWVGLVRQNNLCDFCTSAQLALVEDLRAEEDFDFLEDDDEKAITASDQHRVDVCRLLAATKASKFRNAIALSGAHIESGDTYRKTWNDRFRPLAIAPIKNITVVDRYAIKQHFESPQTQLSGLARFLRMLDKDATGKRYVTLFAAWTAEIHDKSIVDVEIELRDVLAHLPNGNIAKLDVVMIPNSDFSTGAHDRFVRFGHYVLDLGCGLEVLEGPAAVRRSAAAFKSGAAVSGYQQIETELSRDSKARVAHVK